MIDNKEIQALFNNPEDSYVIHFAYLEIDNASGSLKKIISIHSKNLNSTDSREFSIENYASKNDIPFDDIDDWFDDVELSILDEFNSFLKEKSKCNFIYFGEEDGQGLILDELKRIFEARNKAEAKKVFKEIPITRRKNIPFIFQFENKDKTLKSFIKYYNDGKLLTSFLTNGEEGVCFEKKLYNKVRESVLCKIDFIIKLLNSNRTVVENNTNNSESLDIEGLKPSEIFKNMNIKSWLWLFGIIVVIFSAGIWVNNFVISNKNEKLIEENENLKKIIENNQIEFNQRELFIIDSLQNSNNEDINKLIKDVSFKIDSIKNYYGKPIK